MSQSKSRRKRADLPLHITYQNVKDGIAADQKNCTFGQCELSREHGMDFFVDVDPENPQIWAEWTDYEKGERIHHRADVRRRHRDGKETKDEALTIVAATDIAKKILLKKFPKQGMDFVLTNHSIRPTERNRGVLAIKPGESDEERQLRLEARRARNQELKALREQGLAEPPKRRKHRVRARFGSMPIHGA